MGPGLVGSRVGGLSIDSRRRTAGLPPVRVSNGASLPEMPTGVGLRQGEGRGGGVWVRVKVKVEVRVMGDG